jgi:hypothetical protein
MGVGTAHFGPTLDSHIRNSARTTPPQCPFMPRASRPQAPFPPRQHWSGRVASTRTRSTVEAGLLG